MQTAYSTNPTGAKLGLVGDTRLGVVVNTRRSLSTSPAPIGRLYVKDATSNLDGQVKLPGATGDVGINLLEGALILSDTIEVDPTSNTPQYPVGHALPVLAKGPVWVQCETAFNPATDTLYLRVAANGAGTAAGQLCNAADGSNTVSLATYPVKGLNYLAAAGLLQIDLNLA